jgi:Glycosyl hydrolases family 25
MGMAGVKPRTAPSRLARSLFLAGLSAVLFGAGAPDASAQIQRVLGLDISAWEGSISQTVWNNLHTNDNRQFVLLRSSRGGTIGYYDQNDSANANGLNTLSQRYDDPYYIQNINRATTAGMFAGSYHFSRPDIIETTLNSGGIRNNGTDEADHFIQMAGPWMRPGYLVPVHDLEAGDGIRTDDEMTQFCIDFANRIYAVMGIRPGIYVNGNYAANVLQTASASLRDQLAKPPPNLPTNQQCAQCRVAMLSLPLERPLAEPDRSEFD